MLLRFADGSSLASGAMAYNYETVTSHDPTPRIGVSALLGDLQVTAFVDTGGVYFICSPEVARKLGLAPEDSLDSLRLLFRGVSYFGHIHRVALTLPAQVGEEFTVDVTTFVPQLAPRSEWPEDFPCILGMSGCLERLRFAIDPLTDTFYFGELTE